MKSKLHGRVFTEDPRADLSLPCARQNLEVRRREVYQIINEAPFQKYVVFVAAAGFITDAYDIFAVNTVLPMVSFVYWDSEFMPKGTYTAMLCATLIGSMIGQVVFGLLGDFFGRKRMYGLLLVIILWATLVRFLDSDLAPFDYILGLETCPSSVFSVDMFQWLNIHSRIGSTDWDIVIQGLAASADGSHRSMSMGAWMFIWRFLMGIGIGGDYPLSATITSEFAPQKHRSSMLATLFFMQPLGQFLATIVALIVTYLFRHQMQNPQHCTTDECYRAVDRTWRIIVGIGGRFGRYHTTVLHAYG